MEQSSLDAASLAPLTSRPPLPPCSPCMNNFVPGDIRPDKREPFEMRSIFVRTGVSESSSGSCYLSLGGTKVFCSVFGPKPCTLKERNNTQTPAVGVLQVEVVFTPFSRLGRGRVTKPGGGIGQSLRSPNDISGTPEEIRLANRVAEALQSVVLVDKFPNSSVDVCLLILENEGGLTAASLNCTSMALADGGIPLRGLCVSVTIGLFFIPEQNTAEAYENINMHDGSSKDQITFLDKEADRENGKSCSMNSNSSIMLLVDPTDKELENVYNKTLQENESFGDEPSVTTCLHLGVCSSDLSIAFLDAEGFLPLEQTSAALRLAESVCSQTARGLQEELRSQALNRRQKAVEETVLADELIKLITPNLNGESSIVKNDVV